ncbi:uncharacterized protein LOC144345938 [Saccoglossus kowalevskii]
MEARYSHTIKYRHSTIAIHTLELARRIELFEQQDTIGLKSTHLLFTAVGTYLRRLGRPLDARMLCKLMVKLSRWSNDSEKHLKEELRILGRVSFELVKYDEAEHCFEEAVKLYKQQDGEGHIKMAHALQDLAKVRQNNPKYMDDKTSQKNVEQLLLKILKMTPDFHKEDENKYTITYALHQLGRFYQDTGDFDKAHKYFRQSLDEIKSGPLVHVQHVDIAIVSTNLARNYLLRDDGRDLKAALELLESAWTIKKEKMPKTNVSYQLG